jgi:nicotinamide-nucleotide amidase
VTAPTDADLQGLAQRLGERLLASGWMLVCAESCTGGWIAKVLTDIPGSSRWFDRGFVTYSNSAKVDQLGVAAETLLRFGAVSGETVSAMAVGAIAHSHAQVAVSVSGVAGPDGGTIDKPVGLVWFGVVVPGAAVCTEREHFSGDREAVRRRAVRHALLRLLDQLG